MDRFSQVCLRSQQNESFLSGWKQAVAASFSRAARSYEHVAYIQQMIADQLCASIQKHVHEASSILEFGPGTGFLTKKLLQQFGTASLQAVDISSLMLHTLHESLPSSSRERITAKVHDMDHFEGDRYSLICSSCALQWSTDPLRLVQKSLSWLEPFGFCAHALPLDGSFKTLRQEGYLTPEKLPAFHDIMSVLSDCEILLAKTLEIHQTFPSPYRALSHIKSFGGGVSSGPRRELFFLRRKKDPIDLEWNIGWFLARRRS